VAILNPKAVGYQLNIIVFIKTAQGRIKSVSQKLLELNELVYLAFSSGSFDIQIEVLLKNTAEALHFFTNTLSKIPGIVEIDTYINLRVERIPYDWKLPDAYKLSMM
jgi:DNA-binding Lrp family transcriptional regulator